MDEREDILEFADSCEAEDKAEDNAGNESITDEGRNIVLSSAGVNCSYCPLYRQHYAVPAPITMWSWDTGTSVLKELEFVHALTMGLMHHAVECKGERLEGTDNHLTEHIDGSYIDYRRNWRTGQYGRLRQ